MQPSRLLLASLALLGTSAAFAQSSVTLYGRVNTTVEHQRVKPHQGKSVNTTQLVNTASRWGLRGTEDLGGGLNAGFVLESGFASDTGEGTGWTHPTSGMSFARQSEVNLSGGFGMVRLGNFVPESYSVSADIVSMHNHDTGTSADALYHDPVWFEGLSTKNKIAYRTPNFGGVTVEGAVSLHEKDASIVNKYGYDLAAQYNAGPLHLGAGYSRVDKNWQTSLAATYTFGQFTVGGYYQRNDDNEWGSRNNFRLSGMYTLGSSEFHVNVGHAGKWKEVPESSATQATVGYNYNLSKRTKLYTFYTHVDNKEGIGYLTGDAGTDFSSLAAGIRHNF